MTDDFKKKVDVWLGEIGPGWHPLVTRLIEDILGMGWDGDVHQIKEKYGGLRFYVGGAPDIVYQRIDQAERASYKICDQCGDPGDLRTRKWWRTLCDPCSLTYNGGPGPQGDGGVGDPQQPGSKPSSD